MYCILQNRKLDLSVFREFINILEGVINIPGVAGMFFILSL
jgi:hypothetical protein